MLFINMENKKISKKIASLKCLCIFAIIFNEYNLNNHITIILTLSDKNPRFFTKKTLIFKTSKNLVDAITSYIFENI